MAEGDSVLTRIVQIASTARNELASVLEGLDHIPTAEHTRAPNVPGVYFVLQGKETVYVGSAGHGKGQDPKGLQRRLYRQFRRTGLSQVRQGVARDLGREGYFPKRNSEKDPELERRIDERLASMEFSFLTNRTGRMAHRLEGFAIALLDPRFNRQ